MNKRFYIVDVFAERKYAGNQLAVVRDAADLTAEQMQDIAREMHFSETSFILSDKPRDGGYDVRIFTPETELPFAGHPTLGTAFVIRNAILAGHADQVALNLKVGPIPVTFVREPDGREMIWMRQNPPTFGVRGDPQSIAAALHVSPDDIDTRFPIEEVSTGISFLIVPLKTLAAVQKSRPEQEGYRMITGGGLPEDVLVFAPETLDPENQLHVRVYAAGAGVPEDPATGSANGCLAGYLVKHRYFGGAEIDVRVEQGIEIKRPSLLLLRAKEQNGAIEVNVGGRAVLVAQGELV